MDKFRELAERLKGLAPQSGAIFQGIVKALDGCTCTVTIGEIDIPDVRIRASETALDNTQMLVCPKIGSAVILGSLSGDYTDLAILSVDEIDHITINGGKKGGLINITDLVNRLNTIEQDINTLKTAFGSWIPTPQDGGAGLKLAATQWYGRQLQPTTKEQIEDNLITH